MKEFIGFLKKEFIHIFRDPRTLIILFGLPVAQILTFGYVIRNEMQDVRIAIYDKSNDPVTREITNRLLASGFFLLERNLTSPAEVETVFKKGGKSAKSLFSAKNLQISCSVKVLPTCRSWLTRLIPIQPK